MLSSVRLKTNSSYLAYQSILSRLGGFSLLFGEFMAVPGVLWLPSCSG